MKRFYSPKPSNNQPTENNHLLTQRVKSTQNVFSIHQFNKNLTETKKIGRFYYSEFDQIGRGYTSRVFKAYTHERSNNLFSPRTTYAIKVMPLSKSTSSSLELLENQIQILKILDHPNIIRCYDIYKSKTHCYIITQYCPGGCLMTYLKKFQSETKKKGLSAIKVAQVMQQIIEGVRYLQKKGIIHRDIKPANILKGQSTWKIADFGFAIQSFTEIKSKFNVGTPLYMPIESLTENLYSPQSDIFSVGIIFYQLLTGATPWESKSQKELVTKMQMVPFEKTPSKQKIPQQFFLLISKFCCLRKKSRMNKQEFNSLPILSIIDEQQLNQNPETSISDLKQDINSIISSGYLDKKLEINKSMGNIQFLKQKQLIEQNNRRLFTGSMVFQPKKNQDLPILQIQKNKSLQFQKSMQKSVEKKNDISEKKKQINRSNKKSLFQMPHPIKQIHQQKKKVLTHLQFNTRSTEPKSQQASIVPQISESLNCEQLKYVNEVIHILLNQVHYCRFLYYLYKNLLYILLSKKSQQKLSILVFKLIFEILNEFDKLHSIKQDQNSSLLKAKKNKFQIYMKSEKRQIMIKTVKEYRDKYQKEFITLQNKCSHNIFDEVEAEEKALRTQSDGMLKSHSSQFYLKYMQKQVKKFLKEYDQNLFLTFDSINTLASFNSVSSPRNKPNGFISANLQGLKNLYQLYRLIGTQIECGKNLQLFQQKSKIKVNTDYAKNNQINKDQLEKIRQLIQIL